MAGGIGADGNGAGLGDGACQFLLEHLAVLVDFGEAAGAENERFDALCGALLYCLYRGLGGDDDNGQVNAIGQFGD